MKLISKQIHVHNDVESLMKYIPRDVLPKDLGGEEMWLNELVGKIFLLLEY